MTRILDISPLISPRTAVYPMDVPFSREVSHNFEGGDHLTLSSIRTTLHVGAHADAPNHYQHGANGIAERSLELYYGPCQVVRLDPGSRRLTPEDLADCKIQAPRLLLCTGTFTDPDCWRDDFAALSPELVNWLAARGVRLVGIDTPSVDPADSIQLESHTAIATHDMAILEGLVLEHVPAGLYTLIALPLKIEGADASPVRAALLPLSDHP